MKPPFGRLKRIFLDLQTNLIFGRIVNLDRNGRTPQRHQLGHFLRILVPKRKPFILVDHGNGRDGIANLRGRMGKILFPCAFIFSHLLFDVFENFAPLPSLFFRIFGIRKMQNTTDRDVALWTPADLAAIRISDPCASEHSPGKAKILAEPEDVRFYPTKT